MKAMLKIIKVLLLLSLQIPIFPSLENQRLEYTVEMTLDLLDETLPHIQNHIYPRKIALNEWKYKDGDVPGASAVKFNDKAWRSIQLPLQWGGYDKLVWFRTEAVIPQEFSGQPLALVIDLPESLLYLNGSAYQGIDGAHQEVFLTAKARGNQRYSVAIQSYNGRKVAPSNFQFAYLAVVYAPARSLYFALKTLRDLSNVYGNQAAEGKDIREIIRRTLIFLKYFKPDGEEYPNAIGRALNFLLGALGTEFTTQIPGLAHLIGSSRLSPASLWTMRAVPRKAAETFSNAFRLMEEYPEFVFGQSQAYLYSTLEQKFSDVFKGVQQRVTEGRWEPLGGMWVEPDCNIPNGESLVRQMLYGKRFFKQAFDRDIEVAWLPGSYGFNANLPQLLAKSGFKYILASKLLLNDTNPFPYNTFWWQGLDRSKILTHIPPIQFESLTTIKELKRSWDAFLQKETAQDYFLAYGHGDNRVGPSKEQLELLHLFKNTPGLPKTRSSTALEFFKQAELQTHDMQTWSGELYLEKHRGAYTTNATVKRLNRESETLLHTAEVLASLAGLAGIPKGKRTYPQNEIVNTWKRLLTLQDRNILTGTSIADAYEDVRKSFDKLRVDAERIVYRSVEVLTDVAKRKGKEVSFAVFNPLCWERNEYVLLTLKSNEKQVTVLNENGTEVDHQIVENAKGKVTLLCYVEHLLPLSFTTLVVYPGSGKPVKTNGWKINQRAIETPFYRIRLDNKGGISSLYDKQQRRELIKSGRRGNLLQTFVDKPKQWEAWDLDPEYQSKQSHLLSVKSIKVVEEGPLRVVVRFEHRTTGPTRLIQDMILYHKSRRIDFATHVRWFEKQTLLKASFPFDIKSRMPTYEIPFGALERTSKHTAPLDKAKFEVPAQRWADLSDAKGGVSLLNDSKYGYNTDETTMRLSLLRSPHFAHPIDPAKLADNRVSDQGEHRFTYALLPHQGDWRKGHTVKHAALLNTPVIVIPNRVSRRIPPLVSASHANIIIDSIKKAEDSNELILRVYEAHGESRDTTLEFGFAVQHVFECDLMENVINNIKSSKTKLKVKFKPFEVKTLKVAVKPLAAR